MKKKMIYSKKLLFLSLATILTVGIFSLTASALTGDDCSDPIIINIPSDLDFIDLGQTTCGRGDNYINTCLSPYDTGDDIIYELIVSSDTTVDIIIDPYGISHTGMLIDDECPDGDGSCIAYAINTSPPSPYGITNLFLTAGTYYLMIDSYLPETNCIELFDLFITHAGDSEAEYGDAPEDALAYPSMGTIGWFPTCITCGIDNWIQHNNFGAWFGPSFTFEMDGNAGLCPAGFPPYDQDEGFQDGDAGLTMPEPFTIDPTPTVVPFPGYTGTPLGNVNQIATFGTDIDIDVHNTMPGHEPYLDAYVNVLMDWNQDGEWKDTGEHVLVDHVIPALYIGPLSLASYPPPSFTIGPNPGYVWTRFTITETPLGPDWFGEGNFEDGETEDYLLLIEDECEPSIDIEKYVWDEWSMDYVDADDPSLAIDVGVGDWVEYKITIHNDGECCNLIDIWVDDTAEEIEITDWTITPDYSTYEPGIGTNLGWWSLSEPLPPCNWINITVWGQVEGTHCNTYNNLACIEAYCPDQEIIVYDEDSCYIHAVDFEGYEFGDAPEDSIAYPSTMTIGGFPTCSCCGPAGFVQHDMMWDGMMFFGNSKDNEIDGNAGLCPAGFPPYDQDEGFYPGPDGGLMLPDIYTIDYTNTVIPLSAVGLPFLGSVNTLATWGIDIDVFLQNFPPVDAFVNVLADWNQNGQWGDPGEHILINHPIPSSFNGPLSSLAPPPFMIGPNDGYCWFRFTITPTPLPTDWIGDGIYEDGESEDYLLNIAPPLRTKITDFVPGWNNMGLPMNTSIALGDLIINYGSVEYNWSEAWNVMGLVEPSVFYFDRMAQSYNYLIDDTDELDSGMGYWFYAYQSCELYAQNISMPSWDNNVTQLYLGWNNIGIPKNENVTLGELIVEYGGVEYNWSEAWNVMGLVEPSVFYFDRMAQSYNYLIGDDAWLIPGMGYWFYAYEPCWLKVEV